MSFGPKTLSEARRHNYGHFHKILYREGDCIAKVWDAGRGGQAHQCRRKFGYGPEGAFCSQHNPAAEDARQKAASTRWDAKMKNHMAPFEEIKSLKTLLRKIVIAAGTTDHGDGFLEFSRELFNEAKQLLQIK